MSTFCPITLCHQPGLIGSFLSQGVNGTVKVTAGLLNAADEVIE